LKELKDKRGRQEQRMRETSSLALKSRISMQQWAIKHL
jgi:hypothetical protein